MFLTRKEHTPYSSTPNAFLSFQVAEAGFSPRAYVLHVHLRPSHLLAPFHDTIVFVVRSDPHPDEVLSVFDGECPVGEIDPCGPEDSDLLKLQRGVSGIGLQQGKGLIGPFADLRGKVVIPPPELLCGAMSHRSFSVPLALAS